MYSFQLGHEFQAIFLCLLEPLEDGKIKEYFTKSLFNHFVFNTVITRAKSLVVAVGKPLELLEFEDKYISDAANEVKCWHEYLKVSTNSNLQPEIQEEFGRRLTAYKRLISPILICKTGIITGRHNMKKPVHQYQILILCIKGIFAGLNIILSFYLNVASLKNVLRKFVYLVKVDLELFTMSHISWTNKNMLLKKFPPGKHKKKSKYIDNWLL